MLSVFSKLFLWCVCLLFPQQHHRASAHSYCGGDTITTSPPLTIAYCCRKAINTNIAALTVTNTLLSIDLIAALAGCGLLSWRRASHYQMSWHAVPHCAMGLFKPPLVLPFRGFPVPALWPTAVITFQLLHTKSFWGSKVRSEHGFRSSRIWGRW